MPHTTPCSAKAHVRVTPMMYTASVVVRWCIIGSATRWRWICTTSRRGSSALTSPIGFSTGISGKWNLITQGVRFIVETSQKLDFTHWGLLSTLSARVTLIKWSLIVALPYCTLDRICCYACRQLRLELSIDYEEVEPDAWYLVFSFSSSSLLPHVPL